MGTITERFGMICAILLGMASVASATPATLNYQGRIVKTDGTPLEFNNVSFAFEITNASGSCIFYREQRDGVNMQGSKGIFDIAIGEGTKLYPGTANYGLREVFNNSLEHNCSGVATPYTPGVDEVRVLKVQFHDGVGWKAITPNNIIRSVPFASYSYSSSKLGDKLPTDFVLKTSFNSCAAGQYLTFDGTNFLCKNDASGITGILPISQGGTGSGAALNNNRLMISNAGKIVEAPALEDGQILIGKTGDVPQAALLSAGSGVSINNGPGGITISATGTGGTITSVNPGTGLSGGGSSGAVTLNLANTSVAAGTYGTATKVPQFAVDAQGRLTAVTEVTVSGVAPAGTAGGDLDGTYPNPDVVKLRGKAISVTAPTTAGQVLRYDGAQYVPNFLSLADIRSAVTPGNTMFPGSSCAADKTLNWSSLTDTFTCQNISITESNITGSIASAKVDFGTQTAKTFFAAPAGASGAPSFRTIAAADLPAGAYDSTYFKQGGNAFGAAANIGTTDAQNLQFVTGGTARMALTTAGRLGIGTTAPASGLTLVNDSVGDANDDIGIFTYSTAHTPALIMNRAHGTAGSPSVMPAGSLVGSIQSRAYNGVGFVEAAGLRTYAENVWDSATPSTINGALSMVTMTGAAATEKMRVTSEGFVGVGVSVPLKHVHIQKDQAFDTALLIRNASVADGAASAVDVEADGNGAQLISYGTGMTGTWGSSSIPKSDSVMLRTYTTSPAANFGVGTGSAHPLHLVTDDTPRMTVTGTGMIGVGLTGPLSKFTVADLYLGTTGDNTGLGISVYGSANDFGGLTLWDRDGDPGTTNDGDTTLYFGDDPTDNLRFAYKQSGAAMSEKMRLTSTGYLGIGSNNPQAPLHVSGSALYTSIINANTAAGGQAWRWLSSSTAAPLGANSMCFAIGVCYFSLYTTGNATLSGTLTQSSDMRFKKDVLNIDGALNDILNLRGVTYYWKDENKDQSKQMGLIAQEVEKVFPEVVQTDASGYKSVAYQNLVAPLIEAIKELHAKWLGDSQEIRSELSQQKRELASLKEENERLKMKVEEIAVIKKALCDKSTDFEFCKEKK